MNGGVARNPIGVAKVAATNQLGRFTPGFHMRLTGEAGRRLGAESSRQGAEYFRTDFADSLSRLSIIRSDIPGLLAGKRVLEYGPGDPPSVALLMVAHGAEQVVCVDRFPVAQLSQKNCAIADDLLSALTVEQRQRAKGCFVQTGDPASGFKPQRIRYRIDPRGPKGVDLVLSRTVSEDVSVLPARFTDIECGHAR
jgi:hypothetical protein